MRRALAALATTVLTVGALATAAPAHAVSTDFGNACTTVSGASGTTTVYTAKGASNPLPVSAPQSGVVTKVRVTLPPVPTALPFVIKAMRPAGGNSYTVAAQSAQISVGSGAQDYEVRFPIAAGDLIGVSGYAGLYCASPDVGDTVGTFAGDAPVGSTNAYTLATSQAVPVVATVEPDADKDGYGDETQDKCAASATTQAACPVAKIDSVATVAKNKVTVLVTSDVATTASASGTAKAGDKKVTLTAKATPVVPGTLAKLTVKLPAPVKKALAALSSTRTLTVRLTVSATNVAGGPTTDTVKVKLPGRGR